jgi:hypothetical protein
LPGRFELRTNNPWEEICGHTRAVRRGPFVIIAGTTANDISKGVLFVSLISVVHKISQMIFILASKYLSSSCYHL